MKEFEIATNELVIVIQTPEVIALNVLLPLLLIPGIKKRITPIKYVVVLFECCFRFSSSARVGLIAHELAHSFVNGADYKADEAAADGLVVKWGFSAELAQKEVEKASLFGKSRGGGELTA
jgi:hypothetical protein